MYVTLNLEGLWGSRGAFNKDCISMRGYCISAKTLKWPKQDLTEHPWMKSLASWWLRLVHDWTCPVGWVPSWLLLCERMTQITAHPPAEQLAVNAAAARVFRVCRVSGTWCRG